MDFTGGFAVFQNTVVEIERFSNPFPLVFLCFSTRFPQVVEKLVENMHIVL